MRFLFPLLTLAATPAMAATGPFVSLRNTDFVVLLAFILFLIVLLYFKVPLMLGNLLDKRAEGIRADLAEARALREEAQGILATYERKQKEVLAQSERIVLSARDEAMAAAAKAKEDLALAIARRVRAAEDQIASAEATAVREVRNRAVTVAVAAASDVIARQMSVAEGDALIDASIDQVAARMH